MATPAEIVDRRRAERDRLVATAQQFADESVARVAVRAVVMFGSVARGDFNSASDVDVLVVADGLPNERQARYERLGHLPAGVEPVAWTPTEWRARVQRRDPITVEVIRHGLWLAGDPAALLES